MTWWRLLISGLRRKPEKHQPWLRDLSDQQKSVKADALDTRRRIERLLARQDIARRQWDDGKRVGG